MDRTSRDIVLVLHVDGTYSQQLTRHIRQLGVYSELHSSSLSVEEIKEKNPKGIIISGFQQTEHINEEIFQLDLPILAVGSGMGALVQYFDGKVKAGAKKEQVVQMTVDGQLQDVCVSSNVTVAQMPPSFTVENKAQTGEPVFIRHTNKPVYGLSFHPSACAENVSESILNPFLFTTCQCRGDWSADAFIEIEVERIRKKVGDRHVLCALSGGVDSSVVALLLQKAIGDQLTCMFIDHGLLRKGEAESVMDTFDGRFKVNLIKIDAKERFLQQLKGVSDPEEKRKVIGNEFIYVFEEEAAKLKEMDFLAQGTLYTDIIESGTDSSEKIKSHHNVGGLPEDMRFTLIEPLQTLFKDEVRQVGLALGLPEDIVWRQPFPGPGLGIRVLGEVTEEKLYIVRESDAILREEIQKAGLDREVWQYFTALPNMRSVGVTDGRRTYDYTVGIRAVTSVDGTTSKWARIPWDVLDTISERIVAEVKGVNRVVYDITSKPPATIEWE